MAEDTSAAQAHNTTPDPTSAHHFQMMVESASEVIFTTNLNGFFSYVNPAVSSILGYRPAEVVGQHFERFIMPDWREQVVKRYIDQLASHEARSVTEFPLVARSGAERWVEVTINLLVQAHEVTGFLGFLRDISDRKAAEDLLAAERNLLRTVIDMIPDSIFVKDVNHRFLLANQAVAQVNGRTSPDDLIGITDHQMYPKPVADRYFADERRVIEEGRPLINYEELMISPDGQEIWFLTTKMPWRDRHGNIAGLIGVSRDITERRKYERMLQDAYDELEMRVEERTAALRQANEDLQQQVSERRRAEQALHNERNLLRTLIDHLPYYIYVKDLKSRFVLANQSVADAMQAGTPDALIGRTDFDFYPSETAAQFYGDERQVFLTGQSLVDYEELSIGADGVMRWVQTTKVPLLDGDGQITGLVGIGRDITMRKQTEDKLREQQDFLRQLIDNNPGFIFVKDLEGRFTLANKSVADLYGTTMEQVVGHTEKELGLDPELAEQYMRDDRDVILSLTPRFIPEEPVRNLRTGEVRWVQTNKIPLLMADGYYHVLGISTDITERRNAEKQALELAVERERVRLLANFIRDASHDFRTPLSTINTSLYLLGRTPVTEKQRQYLNVIQQESGHLSKLLEGMLKMTRLDSEHFFRFSAVDVNALLETIHFRDDDAARSKGIDFTLNLAAQPVVAKADVAELERALSELVKNAIQFTPAGKSVQIASGIEDGEVLISVADTGPGIGEDDQPHVFERFFRADKARSSDTGGVGLGLSIAQKIIEAHDGRIVLESVPGQGSIFRVYLPPAEELLGS
jgi:PAS domain S-box-containing protein